MQIRIENKTGRRTDTRVLCHETGDPIEDVRLVRFEHGAGGLPTARVEVLFPIIDVVTDAQLVNPAPETRDEREEETDAYTVECERQGIHPMSREGRELLRTMYGGGRE